MSADNLTILVAIAAGLLSFLSPCVLPLVPAYIGQLTAVAVADASRAAGPRRAPSDRAGRRAGRPSATPSPTSAGSARCSRSSG